MCYFIYVCIVARAGVNIPATNYGELQSTLKQVLQDMGLVAKEAFVVKVLQLFETFNVRFGVMLVGPTGGGKTCIYNALQQAATRLREEGSANPAFQRKNWLCAARSVSGWGGWFTSLVLTEKHQHVADSAYDVVIKLTWQEVVGPTA
eukprot:156757-Prorocentrum_minimum.AAC.2